MHMTQISAVKILNLQKNHTKKWTSWRTVRYAAADCPQLKLADLPDLPPSLDKLTTIRRTVRDPVADCPQYTSANSPEPTTSLDKFQIYTADRPLQNSGLSTV